MCDIIATGVVYLQFRIVLSFIVISSYFNL